MVPLYPCWKQSCFHQVQYPHSELVKTKTVSIKHKQEHQPMSKTTHNKEEKTKFMRKQIQGPFNFDFSRKFFQYKTIKRTGPKSGN